MMMLLPIEMKQMIVLKCIGIGTYKAMVIYKREEIPRCVKRAALNDYGNRLKWENRDRKPSDTPFEYADFEDEMLIEWLSADLHMVRYVPNPSKKVQMYVVSQKPTELYNINHPLEEVQWAALRLNPAIIEDMVKPSEAMQMFVVKDHPQSIEAIDAPTLNVLRYVAPRVHGWNRMLRLAERVSRTNPRPSEHQLCEAVLKEPRVIYYIENPSLEMQIIAVRKDPCCIRLIKDPSEAVQIIAAMTRSDNGPYLEIEAPCEALKILDPQQFQ